MTTEDQVHKVRAAAERLPEHIKLAAEIRVGECAELLGVAAAHLLDCGYHLIEVHGVGRSLGSAECRAIECSGFDRGDQAGTHDREIPEQLNGTALLRRRPVIQLVAIDFRHQVHQDSNLVL
jgi:hypothetical protein